MTMRKAKALLWCCVVAALALGLGLLVWLRVVHRAPSRALMKDIRAGIAARPIKDADQRIAKFLEERYGPLSDPLNRREAFLGFFDVEHIRALHLLVKYSPPEQRQTNVDAMARWVTAYRASLKPDDRAALNALFQTGAGQGMLKRATEEYNSQDVQYRGRTAPVISQLLRTIYDVQHGR